MKKLLISAGVLAGTAYAWLAAAQARCQFNGKDVPCEAIGKGLLGLGLGVFAFLSLICLVYFIFWLIMLIHALSKPIENKALWVILLIVLNPLGAILYYFLVKRKFDAGQVTLVPPPTFK